MIAKLLIGIARLWQIGPSQPKKPTRHVNFEAAAAVLSNLTAGEALAYVRAHGQGRETLVDIGDCERADFEKRIGRP